jgi:hypothetical protein
MTLERKKHTLKIRRQQVTAEVILLSAAIVLLMTSSVFAGTGIRLDLRIPNPVLTSISPDKSVIGFTKSLDSIPLLKSDNIKPTFTFKYDQFSQLLVFSQWYGRFGNVRLPATASPQAYRQWLLEWQDRKLFRESYSNQAKRAEQGVGGSLLQFQIPFEVPRLAKSIMGEGGAGLKVTGYRRISFSGRSTWTDQASVATVKQSKFPSLNMEQQSSFTISGNIGSKIFVDVNQDSKRQQTLANKIQLRYKGDEDDVVKTVELGNTNLSLPGTRFTGYSRQIQGLFGVKTTAELGGLKLTAIASQEKSANQGASFKAGSESQTRVLRDYQYLDLTYFDLARRDTVSEGDLVPGDSITELELYFSVSDNANSEYANDKKKCHLFADPFDTLNSRYSSENVSGVFVPFSKNPSYRDYYYHPLDHYVIMPQPMTYVSIGAYIKYRRKVGNTYGTTDYEIGSRPDTVTSSSNAAYVLKLVANASPQPSFVTWNYVWRNVYSLGGRIENPDELELQVYRGDATSTSDRDVSDLNNQSGTNFINLLRIDNDNNGQVDGRDEQIVDRARGHLRFPTSRKPFSDPVLSERADDIYGVASGRQNATKYYLLIKSSTRESEFSLGHADIVSESETVTLNGKQLKRDVDYRMSYDIGRISFLNQDALNPGADVRVDYEYAPLIAAEKKTLLGARAEYQMGTSFKVGSTVLYKSEKTTDRKPRLGEEQSKALNLDADAAYSFQSGLLTKMVDALPLVESTAPSQISVNGEVARSIPNANVSGDAYVDDFEGAREQYSLGVTREGWKPSSIPEQKYPLNTKPARLIWYNPYDQVRVTEIYDREVKGGEDRTHVLVMRLTPEGEDKKAAWGGVMRPLSRGSYDQSKVQFIELRMRGKVGVLHLDLGQVTEDLPDRNGLTNNVLDKEDLNNNGILDFDEDTGLDHMADTAEQRECVCSDPDPHGDDWAYDSRNPYNYETINGRENNGKDPGTNGRPDTEDLDSYGSLDTTNNYYSYSADLAAGENVVPNSERNGWYTLRIPFTDAYVKDSVGSPLRTNITTVRLWIDGVDRDTAYVEIADLQLSRNVWEIQPTLPVAAARGDSAGLSIAVVNTEENTNYESPPGVAGYYDNVNKLQEKEQSLSVKYKELLPGDTAYAQKIPYKVQDLTSYRKLQMWVHGDSVRDSVEYFLRFGQDAKNYYEYRSTIDSGWSTKGSVEITFDDLTQLKLIPADTTTDSSGPVVQPHPHYRVFGYPSLTKIKYYAIGVVNKYTSESQKLATGELWIDELRTTDVRNDQGLAAVAAVSVSLGDLGSVRADYAKQDAFFRNLTQSDRGNLGSGSSSTNYGYSADMRLDKFLSQNERASIPIGYSWRRTEASPRLFTGSDIVVTPEQVEQQKTVSTATHFQIGESWNKQTKNIIYGALLNRFNSNFAYDKSIQRSPTTPSFVSERYTLKGRYVVNSPLKRGLKLFSWLRGMPLVPKRVLGTELNPIPTRVTLDGTVNRTLENTTNSYGVETSRFQRTFQGRFETAVAPINGLDASFNFMTDRDLADPTQVKLTFNPRQAKLGTERQYVQSFSTNYSPQVLPFITGTKFAYSVSHSETVVLTSTQVQTIGTRRSDNSRNFTSSATLDLGKLLGKNKTAAKPAQQGKKILPSGKGGPVPPDSTAKKPKPKDKPKAPADTLLDKSLPKDSTKVPSLDDLRKGNEGTVPTKPPADTLKDSTSGSGKKVSYIVPKSTGLTFALVMAEPGADSGNSPPATPPPPKEEKSGGDKPQPVVPQAAKDSTQAKADSTAGKSAAAEETPVVIPKDSLAAKMTGAAKDTTKAKHDTTSVRADSTKNKPKTPKTPSTPFYQFGLQFIRFFTDRIDPIAGNWRWEERATLNGFKQRPSFLYSIGMSDDPRADRISGSSTSQVDQLSTARGYTFRSGVRLILGMKVAAAYAFSTSDATGKTTQDNSKTFPDLTFTFGKLDYLQFPKLFAKSITLDSRYARRITTSASRDERDTTGVIKRHGKLKGRVTSTDLSPLVKVQIDWKLATGLITTVNFSKTISQREDWNEATGAQTGNVKDFANTLNVKTTYSFRGGSKLWLPLFGKVKIQSALTLDLDISRRLNRTIDYNPTTPKGITSQRTDFSVQPRVTYNFSTNIKGGLSARWQDSSDLITHKKSHVRELEFWVEIRF